MSRAQDGRPERAPHDPQSFKQKIAELAAGAMSAATVDGAPSSARVAAFTIPTDAPESDGTLEWDSTTIVVVEARAGTERGLGWTYAPEAAGRVVADLLAPVVRGRSLDEPARDLARLRARNSATQAGPGSRSARCRRSTSRSGTCSARLLDVPLTSLLPAAHDACRSTAAAASARTRLDRLREQLGGWVESGIPRVKMKLGREPAPRPGAPRRGARGDRRRRRAVRRRERRLRRQGGAALGEALSSSSGT